MKKFWIGAVMLLGCGDGNQVFTSGASGSAGMTSTGGSTGTGGIAGTAGNPGSGGSGGCKASADCDDHDACTDDVCTAEAVCVHAPNPSCGTGGTTGGAAGSGGIGGSGGCVADPYVCQPKDCGLVANECGLYSNCDMKVNNKVVNCETQAGLEPGGPMTCNDLTHRCECAPGDAEAAAYCGDGAKTLPSVQEWCVSVGGCVAAFCGDSPPKVPDSCNGSGQFLPDGTFVWCCAISCAGDVDCDDQNECTINKCGLDQVCSFAVDMSQPPCNGGAGICVSGECVPK